MKQLFLISVLVCSSAMIAHAKEVQPDTIAITNKIKTADLKKYGQMPQFSIKIGSLILAPGDTIKVPVTNNKLTVRYEYSFLKGVYKGANEVTFNLVDPVKKEYELNFSWKKEHEPWRIMIAGAKPFEKKKA